MKRGKKNIPNNKNRRSIRLKGYDYSQEGLYFITICTRHHLNLFGKIEDGGMALNDAGRMVSNVWEDGPEFYKGFSIHTFQIMPNHFHGIIEINENPQTVGAEAPVPALILRGSNMSQGNHRGLPLRCRYQTLFIDLKHSQQKNILMGLNKIPGNHLIKNYGSVIIMSI